MTPRLPPAPFWIGVLILAALPIAIVLLMPGLTPFFVAMGLVYACLILAGIFFAFRMWGGGARQSPQNPHVAGAGGIPNELGARPLSLQDQPPVIGEVMNVASATEQGGIRLYRGRLREAADQAIADLRRAFGPASVPMLREDPELGAALLLVPRTVEEEVLERRTFPLLNWLLFVLTILTTIWAGAVQQGVNIFRQPSRFWTGVPYAAGLLAILGIHELGHYFAAKHHRIRVTPPYFIPVPFALGTFGAFIQMKSPPEDRKGLFDMAVAGPIAGLVVAVMALIVGLHMSTLIPRHDAPEAPVLQSSLAFGLLARATFGAALRPDLYIRLSPLAFAGWLGLFITALNLLPVGQLDGGHIARAMFGTRRGRWISTVTLWLLLLLAIFVWPGLLMWAIIVFFLAGRGTPPLDDLTPLTPGRLVLGYVMGVVLVLLLVPWPRG